MASMSRSTCGNTSHRPSSAVVKLKLSFGPSSLPVRTPPPAYVTGRAEAGGKKLGISSGEVSGDFSASLGPLLFLLLTLLLLSLRVAAMVATDLGEKSASEREVGL